MDVFGILGAVPKVQGGNEATFIYPVPQWSQEWNTATERLLSLDYCEVLSPGFL